ncbi:hypothetical protein [Streptomyces sp. 8L]|uniref:hypothetical protein n=1 Tax=Streptomyces sp. 8L TaxID=2877242 RepID=UPI001CD41CB4|nr:hypothetical protein [Streptomyces sp. 8L]MCA1221299.1 hypothetical protein [Streptomyces sp. 8L]
MRSHDAVTTPSVTPGSSGSAADPAHPLSAVGIGQAEAALAEHYPRLVRLAYLVLPPSLGRGRRVLSAHAIAQRSLPRGRDKNAQAALPAPRRTSSGGTEEPGYALLRARVVRQALDAELPLLRFALPKRSQLPPVLPRVWGLRLSPRRGGAGQLALDQRLAKMPGAVRAALVLRGLERLPEAEVRRVLAAAGVADPAAAVASAARATGDGAGAAGVDVSLLRSPEFDPCALEARPTDLMRRRQHGKAALAAVGALVVCGALLGLPGDGWGPDGPAAPSYALNAAAQAALDPAKVVRVAPTAWHDASRADFSVWPARGPLVKDTELLRRALAVWARPGASVHVSATPGTPSGPPMGPPQLLYAGTVDRARVVLFYDGLRVVRYAEPVQGTSAAAIDFARVDDAGGGVSDAVVVDRSDGNVRYLTAPWVTRTTTRDLLAPDADALPLHRSADGVTDALRSPAMASTCTSWDTLDVRDKSDGSDGSDGSDNSGGTGHERLLTDLGELTPARLTTGSPTSPKDVTSGAARASWARTACLLPAMRGQGVKSVNSWRYAEQALPEGEGTANWVCTRGETWRGTRSKVMAQFQAPVPASASGSSASAGNGNPGAITATATGSPACGPKEPEALAGALWKSKAGNWYLLGAGSDQVTSLTASGGVRATVPGRLMAVPAKEGSQTSLKGRLENGRTLNTLH